LALVLGFLVLPLYSMVGRIAFYFAVRPELPVWTLPVTTQVLFVELWYVSNRRRLGSRSLDLFVLSLSVSLVLGISCAVLFFHYNAAHAGPSHLKGS